MQAGDSVRGYTIDRLIGRGQYGFVYAVTHHGQPYAMKRLERLQQPNEVGEVVVALDEIIRVRDVIHPFIIRYYDEFRENGPEIYLIMELCTHGNMKTAIETTKQQNGHFPVARIELWLVQLLMAVAYLHQKAIVHREVKPNNIFIMEGHEHVKLGDLGLVKALTKSASVAQSSARRTRESYRAPELWQGVDISCKVDEWSLGCVLYELMCLQPPFNIQRLDRIMRADYDPISPCQYSNTELIHVMQSLLKAKPDDRLHAVEILDLNLLSSAQMRADEAHRDMLAKAPLQGIPEEPEDEFTALQLNREGQYPPQPWDTSEGNLLLRQIWRFMVTGYGGTLPFRPYALPAEFGGHTVRVWLVRREPEWRVPLVLKQDLRLWVRTDGPLQPGHSMRLRFHIKMEFYMRNSGQIHEFDEDSLDAVANANTKTLYWLPQFRWDSFDPDRLPSARVDIRPEWM